MHFKKNILQDSTDFSGLLVRDREIENYNIISYSYFVIKDSYLHEP